MEQEEKKWTKVGDLKVMGECDLSISKKKVSAILSCGINHSSFLLPFDLYMYPLRLQSTKGVYVGVLHDNVRVLICFLPSCCRKWLLLKNFHCSLVFVDGFKQPNLHWCKSCQIFNLEKWNNLKKFQLS